MNQPVQQSSDLPQGWRSRINCMREVSYLYSDLNEEAVRVLFDAVIDELDDLEKLAATQVVAAKSEPVSDECIAKLVETLKFYADGAHFMLHDPTAWDTVSGEPDNFQEDEANTATVEDGSLAKLALEEFTASNAGKASSDEEVNRKNTETMLHALEIIAVGDTADHKGCAAEALIEVGFWEAKSSQVSSDQIAKPVSLDHFIAEHGHSLALALGIDYYDLADRDAKIKSRMETASSEPAVAAIEAVTTSMPTLPAPFLVGDAYTAAQMRDYGLTCRRATLSELKPGIRLVLVNSKGVHGGIAIQQWDNLGDLQVGTHYLASTPAITPEK